MQVSCVPEVVYPIVTLVVGFALGNFVVMVREFQVNAAAVDINGRIR